MRSFAEPQIYSLSHGITRTSTLFRIRFAQKCRAQIYSYPRISPKSNIWRSRKGRFSRVVE